MLSQWVKSSTRIGAVALAAGVLFGIGMIPTESSPRVRAADPTLMPRDVLILLDITGSMRGSGNDPKARDIWDQVVQKVVQQIQDLPDGTSLTIVPYDAGPRLKKIWPSPASRTGDPITFATLDAETRKAAIRHVRGLVPNGQNTYICDTLEYGLVQLKSWRELQTSDQRIQEVFLYTDGLDNGRCGKRFVSELVNTFKGAVQDFPFLYGVYIDLNSRLTPAEIAALKGVGIGVNEGSINWVHLDPGPIQLGEQASMTTGVDIPLHFDFYGSPPDRILTATVEVLPVPGMYSVSPATLTITPDATLHIAANEELTPGSYAGAIHLTPKDGNFLFTNSSADFFFTVPTPTTPPPTSTPTATPAPTPAPTPTAAPAPLPVEVPGTSPPVLPLLGLLLLFLAILAFLYWRTPRFAKDAGLEVAGEAHRLRDLAGFAFIKPQQVIVSGAGSQFFLEEKGASEDPTRLVALRGTADALFDPAGTEATAKGRPMEEPGPVSFGTTLAGRGWDAKYVQIEPEEFDVNYDPDNT